MDCIFCNLPQKSIILENELAFAIYDKYPITKGHILVISKYHHSNFFDLNDAEICCIRQMLCDVKTLLLKEDSSIKGFNIRSNVGAIAGQTVMHCHFHLIPRRDNDGLSLIGGTNQ